MTKFTRFKTTNMNFTWLTTQKGEKAIRYDDYFFGLKSENQNDSAVQSNPVVVLSLKNDIIIKSDGTSPNHAPKLSDNVQAVLTGLKHRVLTDNDQLIGKISLMKK